jgi:hypothetical protein
MIELNPHVSITIENHQAMPSAALTNELMAAVTALDALFPLRAIRCQRIDGARPQRWRCVFYCTGVDEPEWRVDLAETPKLDGVVADPCVAPSAAGRELMFLRTGSYRAFGGSTTQGGRDATNTVSAVLCKIMRETMAFRVVVTFPDAP